MSAPSLDKVQAWFDALFKEVLAELERLNAGLPEGRQFTEAQLAAILERVRGKIGLDSLWLAVKTDALKAFATGKLPVKKHKSAMGGG